MGYEEMVRHATPPGLRPEEQAGLFVYTSSARSETSGRTEALRI